MVRMLVEREAGLWRRLLSWCYHCSCTWTLVVVDIGPRRALFRASEMLAPRQRLPGWGNLCAHPPPRVRSSVEPAGTVDC